MKTKQLILAASAFVLAIGGAIASTFAPTNVFVKARLTQNGAQQCVNTNKQCEITGTQVCQVRITTTAGSGGTAIASSTGTFKTYRPHINPEEPCSVVINNSTSDLIVSDLSVYELLP